MEEQVGQTRPRGAVGYPPTRDDEISLVELWLVLLRHKWIVTGMVLLGLVAGVLFATLRQPLYTYTTTVEIGGWLYPPQPVEMGVLLIGNEGNHDVLPKPVPERVFTPLDSKESIRHYLSAMAPNGVDFNAPESKRVPENERTLTLVSEGTLAQAESIADGHQAAVTRLTRFHDQLLENLRDDFESRLTRSEQRLARVEREIQLLDKLVTLFEKSTSQLVATDHSTKPGGPLYDLSERLFRAQERLRTAQTDRETLFAKIRDIRLALGSIAPTRQVGDMESSGPQGPAASVFLALAAVAGLFAGLFGAFFAEFLGKVREARTAITDAENT